MSNVVFPSTFVEREIEAKVERGIKALIASGVKPSDISDKHIEDIAKKAWDELTDAAKFQCGQEGLMLMARQVIGERIAEQIWVLGKGWPTTENEVVAIAESLGIDGQEAIGCLSDYREAANKTTGESLDVFRSLGRFAPLFLGQPKGTTIGEVATRKAASGDKLAMSFIAWRAVE